LGLLRYPLLPRKKDSLMRQWLLQKLTRQRLEAFTRDKGSQEFTLEIGASRQANRQLYPNSIAGDLLYYPALDLQFDAHKLPFADKSFPKIVCFEVLEHCKAPQTVVDECFRLLQDGGELILTTRFIFPIHDAPHDYFRYTRYGLQYLMREFSQVEIQAEAATVETLGVLLQRLAFQCDWRLPLTKIGLSLMARAMLFFQHNLKAEYGDIHKSYAENSILASGYYVVAKK
jgi:SAM-dependent methyltransferase